MPTFNLAKKLQPARKAWKSLKNHLQSKLYHPKFLNSIKTFRQRRKSACKSISVFLHKKILSQTKRLPPRCRHPCHRLRPSNPVIYVDELFPGPVSLAEARKAQENANGFFPGPVDKSGPGSALETHNNDSIEIPGNGGTGPRFRGIDELAEEFIAKVHQEMKLEREQSILEFEEMLKRSA